MLCSRRMDQPFSHLGGFGFVWHWGHQINDSEEIGCGKTPGIRQWGRGEGWPRDEKNIPKVGTLKGLGSAAPIQPLQPHEFFGKRHNGRLGCVSQTIEFLLDIIPGHLSLLSMSLSPRPTLAPAWNSNFSIILAGFSGNSPAAASGDGGIQQRSSPEPPVQEVLDAPTFPAGAGRDQGEIPGHGPWGTLQAFPGGIRAELDAGQGRGKVGRRMETEEREGNEEKQKRKRCWGGRSLGWCWSCRCQFRKEIRQQSGTRCPSSLPSPLPALFPPGTPKFRHLWRGKSPHPTWEPQLPVASNPAFFPAESASHPAWATLFQPGSL